MGEYDQLLVDPTIQNLDGRPTHPGILLMDITAYTSDITVYVKDNPHIQIHIIYSNGELMAYVWDESSEGDEAQGICLIADVEKFKKEQK